MVGDGECAVLDLIGSQPLASGSFRQVRDFMGELIQPLAISLPKDWDQEAFIERHRDTHVNVVYGSRVPDRPRRHSRAADPSWLE